jgi:hypothetical protein
VGLLGWLHDFFYSDDEIVKLADGLSELDAAQYQELLANSGITAMEKNMGVWAGRFGGAMSFATNEYALFVKQSNVEQARQALGSLLERYETEEARQVKQRARGHDSTTDSQRG